MTTVRDLITDSLIQIGALDPNQAIEATAANAALRELNRLISGWANESLMIYTVDRTVFNLVGGTQTYTIGVGGAFNTPYPVRPGQINLVSVVVNGVEIPIDILNDDQWRDITLKTVTSTFPLRMWANGNYPLNTLYFWPIPTQANQLIMSVWGQVTAFPDINAAVVLPPGYEDLIVPSLAVRLSPGYAIQPSQVLLQMAQSAKAHIKSMNWEPTYRSVDSALSGTGSNIGRQSRGYVVD